MRGALVPGVPTTHVPTAKDCGACHGTLAWGVTSFSHTGQSGPCVSCHNGIATVGKPIQHTLTLLDCGSCHQTSTWTVVVPKLPLRPLIAAPRANSGQGK